ncbi:uncharacterized protein LOC135333878 isoform X2 [Halichondria panicea]|uniref:uncharacterized protein LOC135333878 isoform X2 n=1 Tax=Halichondria panicea TaxID=6063 RepID=UPI00312B6019
MATWKEKILLSSCLVSLLFCFAHAQSCTDRSIRLVGGSTIFEGRVEVCNNNAWGTVCDDFWSLNDGDVVCAQLGYGTATSVPRMAAFGQGTGSIVLDNILCTGTETNLFDCPHNGLNVHNCAHSEDAGVICSGGTGLCTDGSIQLVGGANNLQGRVEVCNVGAWGTVCDDSFGTNDAQVVCRQLGYSSEGATAQCCAAYGQGTGSIVLDDLACTGTETSLFDCPHSGIGTHNCGHSEDVGVTCQASTVCTQRDIRLVSGSTIYEGRVEVCNSDAWGTVCDDAWDLNDGNVVCAQLGYGTATSAPQRAAFGQGTGDIVLDDVGCIGTETNLFDCPNIGIGIHNCAHSEDAGVVCSGLCTTGDIRLVGGSNSMEGRVEVCNNGVWGTVCDDLWDITDGNVACRQLGYSMAASVTTMASFGQGTGDIWLDDVRCIGTEAALFDCPNIGIGVHNCAHSEDAGVVCEAGCVQGLVRLQGGEYNSGRVEVCNGGVWGTVCDDGWDITDAGVACRQLGFPEATDAPCCATYGQGADPILLDNLNCIGTESQLIDCTHNGVGIHNCGHTEDAGLTCAANVRLVGGNNIYEGRVEVYYDGAWGTVCDDLWGIEDANVVCSQLGYGMSTSAPGQATFGQGTGSIILDNLACVGTENTLFDCQHNGVNIHNCAHSEDAGAVCEGSTTNLCTQGDVRLVGGTSDLEGRVEVCNSGEWGTVCDDLWGVEDGNIVCRQLGYASASSAPCCAMFGQGQGQIWLDDLGCAGTETSIFDCPNSGVGVHNCGHSEDAGVVCTVCTQNDVRLVGGSTETEGRVEVCNDNAWGTVCDDSWGIDDGNVVCAQLGYGTATSAPGSATFGQGTGVIVLDDLQCVGTEANLFECPHSGVNVHNCAHFEDAGVTCIMTCPQGDVRLVGGTNEFEGRVEICNDNQWGTVCDDSWDDNDAMVVCRQLGYIGGAARLTATFGQGVDPIWLDDVGCTGTELALSSCPNSGFGVHNCVHLEDAGVVCEEVVVVCNQGDIRLVGGANTRQGRVEVCNNNAWGTVCDDAFGAAEATVVCTQLGRNGVGATAQCCAAYGQGTGSIVLDDLACTGTETSLFDCPHGGIGTHNCGHIEDVGVTCPILCADGDLRLVGGANERQGRVEICSNEEWGTVCDDLWDLSDAQVVCYQLGYGREGIAFSFAMFGQGTGPILLDNVGCTGSENRLIECSHNGVGQHNCAHFEDASVQCDGSCTDGDVRLVGGSNEYEGRVELCSGGLWGTVCDDLWDDANAMVVCGQLGYTRVGARGIQRAFFGQGTGDILLDDVQCVGTEARLTDCPAITTHNCAHSEDSGVVCLSDPPITCASLPSFTNGVITYATDTTAPYDYQTMATYSCNIGYTLSGVDSVRTCSETGEWSGTAPVCLVVTCSSLDMFDNGVITYGPDITDPFDFGTTATYSCNDGFFLEGTQVRNCVLDGIWDGAAPLCRAVTCLDLPTISFGSILYQPDLFSPFDYQTTATYSCIPGYALSGGDIVRTCTSSLGSGVWTGTASTCEAITCPALSNPANGQVTFATDTTVPYDFGTVATYTCGTGFGLSGDMTRTCSGDGSSTTGMWSATAPTCEAITCSTLSPITNGVITYSPDSNALFDFGTTATHTCNDGFFREGSSTRTCGGDGSSVSGVWGGAAPMCAAVMCPVLTAPTNGIIMYTEIPSGSLGFMEMATYSCNAGFGLSGGDPVRTCEGAAGSSGDWTGTAPTCEAIMCSVLTALTNGRIDYLADTLPPFDYATVASYICNPGYAVIGTVETRTCRGDGSTPIGMWTGTAPICQVVTCASLNAVNNGVISYSPDNTDPFDFETTATYTCNDGFFLEGSANRVCTGLSVPGFWDSSAPVCTATTCTSLAIPTNGIITYATDTIAPFNYQTMATYSCVAGYGLSGGDTVRTCETASGGGSWVGSAPTCEAITCPDLSDPANGQVTFATDTIVPYDFDTVATYSCDIGFGLSGDVMRTCGGDGLSPNGVWSGTEPICGGFMCSSLSPIANGLITYGSDTTDPFDFGTTATYACNDGFRLGGNAVRTCVGSGSWDGTEPECLADVCLDLPVPTNGVITYSPDTTSPYDYRTVATYSCLDGYGLAGGDKTRECLGMWTGIAPTCEPVICFALVDPINGRVSYSSAAAPYAAGTVATYSCGDGYGLIGGDVMSTCGGDGSSTNGVWDGVVPTCQPITCSTLSLPDNGVIVYSSATPEPYQFGTTARYSCNTGFGLSGGSEMLSCGGDGSSPNGDWSGVIPTCEAITCSLLTINNGMVFYSPDTTDPFNFRTTATYSCNDGFFIEGEQTRNCTGDGSSVNGEWTGVSPVCAAVMCPVLIDPTNGMIMYTEIPSGSLGFMEMATYSCNAGFGLSGGDPVRTCEGAAGSSGDWTETAPTCEAIMCLELITPSNGQVVYSDLTSPYDFNTMATYVCFTGYGLSGGDEMLSCGGDGSSPNGVWSGVIPTCEDITCATLDPIADGVITYNPDTTDPFDFGTNATYSCNDGFFLEGNDISTCDGDGTSVNGEWDVTAPQCTAIMCPDLSEPDNGFVTFAVDTSSPYDYLTMATYGCNTDYGLSSGENVRTCVLSSIGGGEWSGNAPSCEAITCQLLTPVTNGGAITYSPDMTIPFAIRTVATYSCLQGFRLEGSPDRTCVGDGSTSDGTWDGVEPVCNDVFCPMLSDPANGVITYFDDITAPFNYLTTATYSCNNGYGLSGSSFVRICGNTGEWSEIAPDCNPVVCTDLSAIDNGQVMYSPDPSSPYDYGTVATYVCNNGFGLVGGVTRTCSSDGGVSTMGIWDGFAPSCEAISCASLSPINNGSIAYGTDTTDPFDFGTTATYSCNDGFFLSGSATRMCEGDGSSVRGMWSGPAPICSAVVCPDLMDPTNGIITFTGETSGFMTMATYSCNSGYGLSGGDSVRTCTSSSVGAGEWTGTSPTCEAITCPALSDPTNGQVTFGTDPTVPYDYGTMATYSCGTGFGLSGDIMRTCEGDGLTTDGVWSGIESTCEAITCTSLSGINNGIITYVPDAIEPFSFGSTAIYSCSEGFFFPPNVNPIQTCLGDGITPVGFWDGAAPTCTAITCPNLTSPTSGSIAYTTDTTAPFDYQTTATYSCDAGYGLSVGDTVRTCTESNLGAGQWTGTAPACETIVCPTLSTPFNGQISFSSLLNTANVTATYSCDIGFGLSGGDEVLTCGGDGSSPNGEWNGTPPVCDLLSVFCPELLNPLNGLVAYDTVYSAVATYSCDAGYGLSEGDGTQTCGAGSSSAMGTWEGVVPTCEAITCSSLSPIANGMIDYESITYNFGTSAIYTCNDGFFLSGRNSRRCGGDGTSVDGMWSETAPICSVVVCPDLMDPTNGIITFTGETSGFMTMATYSCNPGYGLSGGDSVRTCTSSSVGPGEWSGTSPTCEAITCNALPLLTDGILVYSSSTPEPYEFGTTARYSCDIRYGLSAGDGLLTCEGDGSSTNGTWRGIVPTCEAISCSVLSSILNGVIEYSMDVTDPFDYGTTATYTCNDGFFLESNSERICGGDGSTVTGSWEGMTPVCTAITCINLNAPTNGIIAFSSGTSAPYDYQTTATYSCNTGYGLSGKESVRTCLGSLTMASGEWSGTAPTCEAVTCSELSTPDNGQVLYASAITLAPFDFGTTATYQCDAGFGLVGETMSRCGGDGSSSNGVWTGTPPTCEAITCPALSDPTNGQVTFATDITVPFDYGTMATYSCDIGFGLSGNNMMRTCGGDMSNSTGVWSGSEPTCEAITCTSLSPIANGLIGYESNTFNFGTSATYTCTDGFFLIGGNSRRCGGDGTSVNGVWSETAPICSVFDCPELMDPTNGAITFSTSGSMPTATYSCDSSYGLSRGDTVRTCTGSPAEWSGTAPTCNTLTCVDLPTPVNGAITFSSLAPYEFGATASYSCNTGYGLGGGDVTRSCGGDGSSTNGGWSGTPPTCNIIFCTSLSPIVNGMIVYSPDVTSPYDFGTAATYSCNDGFYLDGEQSRNCAGDGTNTIGTWDLTAPICTAITCGDLAFPSNGLILYLTAGLTLITNAPFDYQTIATYSCAGGYAQSGGNTERTCVGSILGPGEWTGISPICEAITCLELPAPVNGQISYAVDMFVPFDYSTVAIYSCDTGYGLSGGDLTRSCEGDDSSTTGSWSGSQPTCEAIVCPDLPTPMNGQVVYASTAYGAIATYSCDTGFGLSGGDGMQICGEDFSGPNGVWEGIVPTCEAITCTSLSLIDNGLIAYNSATFDFGTTATYSCNIGFFLSGSETRMCGGDGSSVRGMWSGTASICSDVMCPTLMEPENGLITLSIESPGSTTATYSCDTGYVLAGGDSVRTCTAEVWDGTDPTCEAITCISLPLPDNGAIVYSSATPEPYQFGTTARYSCNTGFGPSGGDEVLSCGGDGSSPTGEWSGVIPTCEAINCAALSSIDNGGITYDPVSSDPVTLDYGTTATYSCNDGFFLEGNVMRNCGGDGTSLDGVWDGVVPICSAITCSGLSDPTNGIITFTMDTDSPFDYQTAATYSCNIGFGLTSGDSVRMCLGSSEGPGEWNGTAPFCEAVTCADLAAPTNGQISYSTTLPYGFGTVASYSCDTGYGLVGIDWTSMCNGDSSSTAGMWIGTPPTCEAITCTSLPLPGNGAIVYSSATPEPYQFGTTARYSCNTGYGLNGGDEVLSCGGDGSSPNGDWNGVIPTCEAVTCPELNLINNGMITYSPDTTSSFGIGTTATYSCADGHVLSGSDTRMCEGDGSSTRGVWSGNAPICSDVFCSTLFDPTNGHITFLVDPSTLVLTATYACDPGYGLSIGDMIRTCLELGWSGAEPVCEAISCPALPVPTNGQVTFSDDHFAPHNFGTVATYSCTDGYGLIGGDVMSTCGGDGSSTNGVWSGTAPTCEAITCPGVPLLVNGVIAYSDTPAPYDFGTMATYTCDTGYGLIGDITRTCDGDGSSPNGVWSGSAPTCNSITCTSLSPITNGRISYSPDATSPFDIETVATYSCIDGFFLSGSDTRTCEGDGASFSGMWSGTAPICSDVVCPTLNSPENGQISFSVETDGSTTATYSCDTGYGLSGGDSVRTCTAGVWTVPAPICEAITCPALPLTENGVIVFSTSEPYNLGTTATYSCNTGYGLSGGVILTCGGDGSSPNGEWSGTPPTCETITCPGLSPVTNGDIFYDPDVIDPYDYDTMATYSCDVGYFLEGNSIRRCGGDGSSTTGSFDGLSPICTAITCSTLAPPMNGMIIYATDTTAPFDYQTTATYSCDAGYGLSVGDTVRTCSGSLEGDGYWTGTAPICRAPGVPNNPNFQLDDAVCGKITISWDEPLEDEQIGGISRYRVMVTKRSTGESDSMTTSDLFLILNNLECCQAYDFSVAAGNSDVFGDALYHNDGFRTRPDVSVLPDVSVTVESDTTLSISWVEPSSLTHLPSDTYTVTVTPTCMNGDTAVFTPPPQMVAFDATPTLQVTNLNPQVPYRVSFDAVVCESNISIYDDTVFTVPGVDIGSPTINSASRLTEDPSKARVEWTPTANVVDVQIYSGNTFNEDNLIRSDKVSSPINTAISLTELDVCTPYWFVVRAATCGDAASSAPVKVDLDDTKLFELSFKLEDADRCTSFKQSESKQTVSKIEDLMNITLLSTDCGAFAVSCFAGSVLTCDGSDASLVYFSTSLVGHGTGKTSSSQESCLNAWLAKSPRPTINISNGLKPVELSPVSRNGFPVYAIVLIAIGCIALVTIVILAAIIYRYYRRKYRAKKVYFTENFNPSVNNPTYEEISGFMAENPVFSEDTMEKAATPLSAGNPGFIDSGGAPPDYSSFMAKEKEAEALGEDVNFEIPPLDDSMTHF